MIPPPPAPPQKEMNFDKKNGGGREKVFFNWTFLPFGNFLPKN